MDTQGSERRYPHRPLVTIERHPIYAIASFSLRVSQMNSYLCRAVACAAFCLLSCVSLAAHATTTLVINEFLPQRHVFNTRVMKPWAQAIEQATDGRVKIVFPPTSIAAPQQLWDAVRHSVVDGAYLYNGNLQNQLQLMQLAQLPLGSTSAERMSVALWRTYQRYFATAGEYRDVQLLAVFVFPGGQIFGLKHPIDDRRDLAGVKIWALPGVAEKLLSAAGAGVLSTPAAMMSEIVAGGTVDAFAGIPEMDANAFKVVRYARYETVVPGALTAPGFSLVVNKASWASIAPHDRDIILKLSGAAFAKRLGVIDRVNAKAQAAAQRAGLQVRQAAPPFVAQLRALAAPMDAAWLADAARRGVDGQAALSFYRRAAQGDLHE